MRRLDAKIQQSLRSRNHTSHDKFNESHVDLARTRAMGIEGLECSSPSVCPGQLGCLAATGQIFTSSMSAFKATSVCSNARDAAGSKKPLDCQPYNLAVRFRDDHPPYCETLGTKHDRESRSSMTAVSRRSAVILIMPG